VNCEAREYPLGEGGNPYFLGISLSGCPIEAFGHDGKSNIDGTVELLNELSYRD